MFFAAPLLRTVLCAVCIVDGVALIEASRKTVELEVRGCNFPITVHSEDVNAFDGVLSAAKLGGHPLPYHYYR